MRVRRNFKSLAVASALFATVCVMTVDAQAAPEVSPTGKGIAGGALLGGEIGFLGLAAFDAKSSWLYYTIPPLLAVGGGVGGYFIEQGSDSPNVPLFMLAGGMALVIPTVVITLSATTYRPGNEDSTPVDASPSSVDTKATVDVSKPTVTGGSPSSPAGGGGSGTSTTTPPPAAKHKPSKTSSLGLPAARSFALVNMDSTSLRVGVPAVSMRPTYTLTEVAKFGLVQRYEVHAPLVDIAF